MDAATVGQIVTELHGDLARKYKIHASTVEKRWRSFDVNQRARSLRAGAAEGVVLKHSLDASMGNVHKVIPEWNLRDITERGPEVFLELLRHRATKTIFEQYCAGINGEAGDHAFIVEAIRAKGLRHVEPFKNRYSLFLEHRYGESFELSSDEASVRRALEPAFRARLCIPQSTGELVLQRQMYLLQCLNIMIEDILDQGATSRNGNPRPKQSNKATSTTLSKLSPQTIPAKSSLPELIASAFDQRASIEEYLSLLSTEPVLLTYTVNTWFFSRPELIPDEKGRHLPLHTDRYISIAFFDAVHSVVKAAAIWDYISRLLKLLESLTSDRVYRAIILQELANICHLEYNRAQAIFKRQVQSGTGSKWFHRLSNVHDNYGNARVTMKGNPEFLTRADPQLHYILRLCQSQITALEAFEWLKKLSGLHESHPMEREKLDERELDAFGDLAVIIGFGQDLTSVISLPAFSRKKGQIFVSRVQSLEAELNQLSARIDVSNFAVPIDHLLEPGMSLNALKVLDEFVIKIAGSKIGLLYQDLVEQCFADLQNQYKRVVDHMSKRDEAEGSPPMRPVSPSLEERVEQRKQKDKTRPSQATIYEIVPHPDQPTADEPPPTSQILKVRPSTVEVFSNLFTKSRSRGSVSWEAFQAALTDIGFSSLPKYGSAYTFIPPDSVERKKPFTVHRPHRSQIEGHKILIFARRLKRLYGWDEKTFEVN